MSIFAVVVQDIADLEAARREVGILNRQSVFAKFHLIGQQLIASVAIPCLPFVPRHLVGMVELMGKELDQLDDALALRVRGRRWIDLMTGVRVPGDQERAGAVNPPYDPTADGGTHTGVDDGDDGHDGDPAGTDPDDAPLPEELLTLLQLRADDETRPDPAVVADVCHNDRALILRLIRLAEEQTIGWRRTLDEARAALDTDAARDATGELRGWNTAVRDLRGALRHLVTFGGPDEGSSG